MLEINTMTNRPTTVGSSSRTPFKHWLLNSFIGKIIGAQSTGNTPCNDKFLVVDMCAGDGADVHGERTSSPSIIRHHLSVPTRGKQAVYRRGIFFEKDQATCKRLAERHGDCPMMTIHHEDARNMPLSTVHGRGKDGILIYADPNNIDQLPITAELMSGLSDTTLMLITLGCNVGGLKRIPYESRVKWIQMAEMVRRSIGPWHDLGLITLNKDASQWAYMVIIPRKWSTQYLDLATKAGGKLWPAGVSTYSMRAIGNEAFMLRVVELFQTTEENKTQKLS